MLIILVEELFRNLLLWLVRHHLSRDRGERRTRRRPQRSERGSPHPGGPRPLGGGRPGRRVHWVQGQAGGGHRERRDLPLRPGGHWLGAPHGPKLSAELSSRSASQEARSPLIHSNNSILYCFCSCLDILFVCSLLSTQNTVLHMCVSHVNLEVSSPTLVLRASFAGIKFFFQTKIKTGSTEDRGQKMFFERKFQKEFFMVESFNEYRTK